MPEQARTIPLSVDSFGRAEHRAALRVLRSGRVTQGPEVKAFEQEFRQAVRAPSSVAAAMVNSGSSANLLAASLIRLLADNQGDPRREVITPALTWATTVAPLIQNGFKPVFVDVGPDFVVDPDAVEAAITPETLAIAPVHLIGNAADMTRITALKRKHGLHVLEDCCEALGTQWAGQDVGTFGGCGSFSFYYSHHVTTIEGGMLLYPERRFEALALREHGWIRHYPPARKEALARIHPDLHPTWTFDQLGYNLRSTDLNAAIGRVQIARQAKWAAHRRRLAEWFDHAIKHPTLASRVVAKECTPNPFSYPLLIRPDAPYRRDELMQALGQRGVETRPVMTGDITQHPWYRRHPDAWRIDGDLARTRRIHENGLLIPCRPGMDGQDRVHVAAAIDGFLREKTGVGLG